MTFNYNFPHNPITIQSLYTVQYSTEISYNPLWFLRKFSNQLGHPPLPRRPGAQHLLLCRAPPSELLRRSKGPAQVMGSAGEWVKFEVQYIVQYILTASNAARYGNI